MKELIIKKPLFGSEIVFGIYGCDNYLAKNIIEDAYREALRLQKIFNFFDKKSELSKLNNKRTLNVSSELLHVLKKSIKLSKQSNGEYDLALGKSIKSRKEFKKIKKDSSYKNINIIDNKVSLTDPHALIDLGSIAKGFITDRLADFFKKNGVKEFFIDSRGDILFNGSMTHIIGIQHPRKKSELVSLKVKNECVATSGDYNQFYGSFETSHIINQKEIISVTVISDNLEDADLYATVLLVLNNSKREDLIKSNKIKVMTVDKNLNIRYYNGFKENLNEI